MRRGTQTSEKKGLEWGKQSKITWRLKDAGEVWDFDFGTRQTNGLVRLRDSVHSVHGL